VPFELFNPAKTALDLLRPAHQPAWVARRRETRCT
jgi:hypothetical protein